MTTLSYTTIPGAPHYVPPALRLYRAAVTAGPGWGVEHPLSDWKPTLLHWRANGQVSTLGIECVLGRGAGKSRRRPESVTMAAGDRIRLVDTSTGREWFRGYAGQMEILVQSGRDVESCTWVVYGPEQRLRHKVIQGKWYKTEVADDLEMAGVLAAADANRANVWQSSHPCVFNEHGKPNAGGGAGVASPSWKLDSDAANYPAHAENNQCLVFEPTDRVVADSQGAISIRARRWNAYTALRSVVEWVDQYDVLDHTAINWDGVLSTLASAGGLTADIADVDVHGMNLLEAMAAILNPIGYGFAIEPWSSPGTDRHRLVVFSLETPTARRRPGLAALSDDTNVPVASAAGKRAVVQRLHFARDSHNVANQVIVLGDSKRVQVDLDFGGDGGPAAWDLKPFWDTSAHAVSQWYDSATGRLGHAGSPNAVTVDGETLSQRHDTTGAKYPNYRHVYRSFVWNEDGSACQFGWDVPDAADFGLTDSPSGESVRRPRPMMPTLTYDARGKLIPVTVSMALVNPSGALVSESWITIQARPWPQRCGFTIEIASLMGAMEDAGWRPWKANKDIATKALPVAVGNAELYQDLKYLELLHDTITDAADRYKLVLRLSGTIEADDVVRGVGTAAWPSRWPFTSQRLVAVGNRFQHKVRDGSHLWSAFSADVADERTDAAAYADRLTATLGAEMGHASILLRHLSREYQIGDGIPETSGRRIDFGLDAGSRRVPIVLGVTWTFTEDANKTELVLDSPLLGLT